MITLHGVQINPASERDSHRPPAAGTAVEVLAATEYGEAPVELTVDEACSVVCEILRAAGVESFTFNPELSQARP